MSILNPKPGPALLAEAVVPPCTQLGAMLPRKTDIPANIRPAMTLRCGVWSRDGLPINQSINQSIQSEEISREELLFCLHGNIPEDRMLSPEV